MGTGLEDVGNVEMDEVVAEVMSKLRAAAGLGGANLSEEAGGPPPTPPPTP